MKKMYRVFVSSTFEDLQDERLKILNTLLSISCVPSGMELFSAASEEQFAYIKRIIEDVDYFILIIAGRYGSIAKDGKSYTQKEFEYAQKLGIPILVFLHATPDELPYKYTEHTDSGREKLIKFKESVSKDRLVAFWNNSDELSAKIITGLQEEINNNPQNGWVKNHDNNAYKIQAIDSKYHKTSLKRTTLYKLYKNRIVNLSKQVEKIRDHNVELGDLINITEHSIRELVNAFYEYLNHNDIEAVIVIEKIFPLDDYIKTGIEINATISRHLIQSVLTYKSSLHDGAIIIRDNRIISVSCYLPLSENPLYQNMELAYRSAIGITEVSDCMVLMSLLGTDEISCIYNEEIYLSHEKDELVRLIFDYFKK